MITIIWLFLGYFDHFGYFGVILNYGFIAPWIFFGSYLLFFALAILIAKLIASPPPLVNFTLSANFSILNILN